MIDFENQDGDVEPARDSENGKTAFELLPRVALEQALGADGLARIEAEGSLCLVVRVPDQSWITPISTRLRELGSFTSRITSREKSRKQDDTSARIAKELSEGEKVFGVSSDPHGMLPSVLMASADIYIDLKTVQAGLLSSIIHDITGDKVDVGEPAAGLTFEEIVTSIRFGSTGQECADRLAATASRRNGALVGLEGAVPVEDLVGYGEAKTWAQNLVLDIAAWRNGNADFETFESRVVLAGPPGTGKTTFAKSVAASAGIPLFATSASAWFLNGTGYLDSVIKQIDGVFAAARAQAPAMVFIDELDAVPSRASLSPRNRDWWLPVVTHILTLLDGANESNRNLVIVGATNYADRLDEALVRAGRLSRLIQIEPPTPEELALILRQHLRGDLADVDLSRISSMMSGSTGADIAEAAKRARGDARRSGRAMVVEDLLSIVAPPETRPSGMIDRISIHESGHAVVAHLLGAGQVRTISLIARGAAGGSAVIDNGYGDPTRENMEHRVMQLLGGRAAEKVLLGGVGTGSGGRDDSDLARATSLVASLHASLGLGDSLSFKGSGSGLGTLLQMDRNLAAAVETELQDLHERTESIIAANADLVRAVSEALSRSRYLTRDDFLRIVERMVTPDAD